TIPEPGIATLLLHRWPALSPSARSEVIARMLSRPAWRSALLDAIEAGKVPAAVIPPNRRDLLLSDRDAAIRHRAHALLDPAAPLPPHRAPGAPPPPQGLAGSDGPGPPPGGSCPIPQLAGAGRGSGPRRASVRARVHDLPQARRAGAFGRSEPRVGPATDTRG